MRDSRVPERGVIVNADLLGGLALLAVGSVGWVGARGHDYAVWFFPRWISVFIVVMGAGLLIKSRLAPDRPVLFADSTTATRVAVFGLGMTAYACLMPVLGFWVGSAVMYSTAAWALQGSRSWGSAVKALAVGILVSGGMYVLFGAMFNVPLPAGSWWLALGE